MNKITIIAVCIALLVLTQIAHGQQFKWVTGGGTNEAVGASTGAGGSNVEGTYYMCTDPNGNVYALSVVGDNAIYADTFYKSGAYGAPNNLLVTSYDCSGHMRWAKLIASSSAQCIPHGIMADTLGHIYIAGNLSNQTLYIGYDTTIPSYYDLAVGLIQLDTNGNFKWVRYVGNNTLTTLFATLEADAGSPIAIDGANNVHYFVYTKSGVPLMPGDTSRYGVYDMTYNTAGTLLSAIRLDLDSQWFLHGTVIDPSTGKLYVYGEVNQSYGIGIVDTYFAAAFDASRHLLWRYFCGYGDDDGFTGIALDQTKHLYFSGAAAPHIGETRFVFNGDSVLAPYYELAIIMKTDTNGRVNWMQHYDSHESINYFSGLTLLPNSEVAVTGTFSGKVYYGIHDSLVAPATIEGQDPYLVIVDSAGDLEIMQKMDEDGPFDGLNGSNVITSDRVGNMYVGGVVTDSVYAGSLRAYHSVGGNSDFFIAKYGVDCSCTSMPVAAYTDTGTQTIGYTYTGTTAGVDSIVWNFDDGSASATGTTAVHTYTAAATYRVCVTVYTDCGEDLYCKNVTALISLATLSAIPGFANVRVFPNPANEVLNIAGISANTIYHLQSITGNCVLQGIFVPGNNTLPLKNFTSGVYILEMTGSDGTRSVTRIVKD